MPIPIGIEVLVKKAAIDPDFRQILLARRAYAADEIALKLEPSEAVMINAVPAAQLEAIVARTTVHPKQRAAFLGRVAAVMIVALSASGSGCGKRDAFREKDATDGIRPDRPEEVEPADEQVPGEQSAEDVLDRDDNRPIVIFGYTADENDRGN
ncbi:MAG: hypothetical protein JW889_10945 [Verrucomicrobia bacterium]|nr:hypothetical protein [Verrucomicrobiota bacterium]